MFVEKWKLLNPKLVDPQSFQSFPQVGERGFWESLPVELADTYISSAEKYSKISPPLLPASLYMEYRLNGNRVNYQKLYYSRRHILTELITAECIEYKGRFVPYIVDMIWLLCEESSWVVPAHNSVSGYESPALPDAEEPIVALFSAETGALLAWALYLLKPQINDISPLLNLRIKHEINKRLIQPYLKREDFFWMGLMADKGPVNNWNPWINSNMLIIAALGITDLDTRVKIMEKVCLTLDRFLSQYGEDGGCDEGTTYWSRAGGSLFDCLELFLSITSGNFWLYDNSLIGNIGTFLYKMNIDGPWFVNFADAGAKIEIDSALVYMYGKRINDTMLESLGLEAFKRQSIAECESELPESLFRRLRHFSIVTEMSELCRRDNIAFGLHSRDYWLSDVQVGIARENEGSKDGLFLAFKGGHNNESHNHNDIGSLILSLNGKPVLIDIGVETYSKKTFSDKRYEIWTMQSLYHNIPEINGTGQVHGSEYYATDCRYHTNSREMKISMELSGAYPENAQIDSWARTMILKRGTDPSVKLHEQYRFINDENTIVLNFITPWKPGNNAKGEISLFNGSHSGDILHMLYPVDLNVDIETIGITDSRLRKTWPEKIYRISLKTHIKAREGNITIIFKTDE